MNNEFKSKINSTDYHVHILAGAKGFVSGEESGFIVLGFKVMDDNNTQRFDQGWSEWSGAAQLTAILARNYEIRKVTCYKGVNIYPGVFKYIILIEFIIPEG